MSKSGNNYVKVFYRIFPSEKAHSDFVRVKDKRNLFLRNLQELSDPAKVKKPGNFWEFKSDGVFVNSTQENVYSNVAEDVLNSIVKGYSGIIAAYGQTGSGKSVTVGGLQLSEEDFGITLRIVNSLFDMKTSLPRNIKMCIQVSYAEFSKSTVADLLKPFPNFVDIWHTKENITKVKVRTRYEALKLLYTGEARKTLADNESYMSHLHTSVVTFYITTKNIDFSDPYKISSRLHVIDMAGVDTVGNLSCTFKSPFNIGEGNLAKTDMEQFFLCLMSRNSEYIRMKGRLNPLIYFLGNDLSSQSILRFIGHIKILKENLPLTISILRFGQLVRGLKPTKAKMDVEFNEDLKIKYLKNQLEQMQREKLQNSVLLNQDLTKNLDTERIDHLHRTINEYLKNHITEINVMNVAEVSAVFKAFKDMCNQCEQEKMKIMRELKIHSSEAYMHKKRGSSVGSIKGMKMAASGRLLSNVRSTNRKIKELPAPEKGKRIDKVEKSTSVPSLEIRSSKLPTALTTKASSQTGSLSNKKRRDSVGHLGRTSSNSTLRLSTTAVRRSSVIKRKSNASMSISERRDAKMGSLTLLTEVLPENKEAWDMYLNELPYKELLENYKDNEDHIKQAYAIYMEEIAKLHNIRNVVETMKNDIMEAKMVRTFTTTTKPENDIDTAILSEAELICQENLERTKSEMLEQQEVVLKIQSELRIYLKIRKDLKIQLNVDFENYCKEKFSVTMPNLKDLSEEELMKYSVAGGFDGKREETSSGSKFKKSQNTIESLKKIMKTESDKNRRARESLRITWRNH